MEGLLNPLNNIRKPTGSQARDRRLRVGEFEKLHALLSASGNPWAAPAFELAIETSLRQSALFSARWEWLDVRSQMLRFPPDARGADNKSVPAVLPLSRRAVDIFRHLAALSESPQVRIARSRLGPGNVVPEKLAGPVFGTSMNAVICVWKRVIRAASIEDAEIKTLRWHDLRHEAASRLFEKGLHPMEVASITGHRSMQMLKRYTHLKPESLLARLG
ncbi:site-specific integrase [Caballeronia sp. SEWSISQ10-4 2]|uniref:site-specific integrase n=1 Tax=Caballeronia sp. SEWSISQ10-4 2 TaxID=2937438 RepID=UPI00265451ED|nr:site-specific integrase [Caballeronia sp. SEWSISQ10-4 2]MDN7184626.1 site-specific integrase [Caballeronia sp. SEWSISQ10-4 2]